MLQAYSTDIDVAANAVIPFNNVSIEKGCTSLLVSPGTINFNKCGVYMVAFDGSVSSAATVQLFKDGVALPQAQSTSVDAVGFVTFVQVDRNNCECACSSPVSVQVKNIGAATTFTNANICVSKLC